MGTSSLLGATRGGGPWIASTFVAWRGSWLFRLGPVFRAAYGGAQSFYETEKDALFGFDTIFEHYESGDLEYIVAALGGVLVVGHLLWA